MGYRIVVQDSDGAEQVHMVHTLRDLNEHLADLGAGPGVVHGTPSGVHVIEYPDNPRAMVVVYWTVVKDTLVGLWRAARQFEEFGQQPGDDDFSKGQAAGYRAASARIDSLITQFLSEA